MTDFTRRDALVHLAGITGSLSLPRFGTGGHAVAADRPDESQTGSDGPLTIIDTHTHFYDPTRPEGVPWPGKGSSLYRTVLPRHYRAQPTPAPVTGTVVVEASNRLEDNQWILDLAKDDPFIVGFVGHLTVGDEDFGKHLKRFAKNPLFRGIRISSAVLRESLADDRMLTDLQKLSDADLSLDVNGRPDMLPDVARLAERLQSLRIIINHVTNLKTDGNPPPRGWTEGMQAAAAHPHVYCKVSALVENAGARVGEAPADVAHYKPMLDALWEIFGGKRLVYGSNWPVSDRGADLATVQSIVTKYFSTKGPQALQRFFAGNARDAYKWIERKEKTTGSGSRPS